AYGAILHQRKIIPIHGSTFIFNDEGIMICGDAGAGKSSLTAAFCFDGAEFLTDDITPLIFSDRDPYILALSDRIKLWSDSLAAFEAPEEDLSRIDGRMNKFYYPMSRGDSERHRLSKVFILNPGTDPQPSINELEGAEKFESLRNCIYRPEYLKGMPDNNEIYFKNLIQTCASVRIFSVSRPAGLKISEMKNQMAGWLNTF
ncbi:MAG: hypothetical protein IH594_14690, partial [Bacteroidales bacterium]|nr:hypothetical protein [Bacteroidales bacterium]